MSSLFDRGPSSKTCPKCGEAKPLDAFGFNRKTADGRQTYCKRCRSADPTKFDQRPGLAALADQGLRRCTRCGSDKSLSGFYELKRGGHQAHCKECVKARRKAHYAADPGKSRAATRRWYEANQEKALEYARDYQAKLRAEQPEKVKAQKAAYKKRRKHVVRAADARYREANRERLRDRHRQWREQNRERMREILRAHKRRRRLRLADSGGSHTTEEWEALKAFYDHTCLMCGRREPEIQLTRDHVIPISKGGTDYIWNLQPLCLDDNRKKNARHIDLRGGAVAPPLPLFPDEP